MMHFINQFSYPIFAIILGIVLVAVTSRLPRVHRVMCLGIGLVYVMMAIIVGVGYQYPASPVPVQTVADVENSLVNKKPTFVMLYSNY
jgi:hypothetical protein